MNLPKLNNRNLITNFQPIICTGFHRSGTSLTAEILQESGVFLGKDLVGTNFSNPDGHFEDWDAVRLHDTQLTRFKLDWQATTTVPDNDIKTQQAIDYYIKSREKGSNNLWGVKDPRIALFLPYWERSLTKNAVFIFPVRHWSECIQSLHLRHAKHIAFYLSSTISEDLLCFWKNPLLAAQMWLNSNSELLNFVKKHPERTLVVPHHRLQNGYNIIDAIKAKFLIPLNTVDIEKIINPKYNTATEIYPTLLNSLPNELLEEIDSVFKQLMNYAETNEPEEFKLNIAKTEGELWHRSKELVSLCRVTEVKLEHTAIPNKSNFKVLTYEQLLDLARTEIHRNSDTDYLSEIINHLITLKPTNWNGHEFQGSLHLRLNSLENAIDSITEAIILHNQPPPYLHHILSEIHFKKNEFLKALHLSHVSLIKNPQNPNFHIQKHKILIKLDRLNQAREVLDKAIEVLPDNPHIQKLLLTNLQENSLFDALTTAYKYWGNEKNPIIGDWLINLLNKHNIFKDKSNLIRLEIINKRKKDMNLNQWFDKIFSVVGNTEQSIYLIYLITQAWNSLE